MSAVCSLLGVEERLCPTLICSLWGHGGGNEKTNTEKRWNLGGCRLILNQRHNHKRKKPMTSPFQNCKMDFKKPETDPKIRPPAALPVCAPRPLCVAFLCSLLVVICGNPLAETNRGVRNCSLPSSMCVCVSIPVSRGSCLCLAQPRRRGPTSHIRWQLQ